MRFNIVGSDPKTGNAIEMVVNATNVGEAASVAGRRRIHVMSVFPAELEQTPVRLCIKEDDLLLAPPVSRTRPGKGLRTLTKYLLVGSFFWVFFIPSVSFAVGVIMLLSVGAFAFVPTTRDNLRHVLGVTSANRIRSGLKLGLLAMSSLFLLTMAHGVQATQDKRRVAEEQRLARETTAAPRRAKLNLEVSTLLDSAHAALRNGDVPGGVELAVQAARVVGAPNHSDAVALIHDIEGSSDPEFARRMLADLPTAELAAFREHRQLTASLDLGFEALNNRFLESLREQIDSIPEPQPSPEEMLSCLRTAGLRSDSGWRHSNYDGIWYAVLQLQFAKNEVSCCLESRSKGLVETIELEAELYEPGYQEDEVLEAFVRAAMSLCNEPGLVEAIEAQANWSGGRWHLARAPYAQGGYGLTLCFR